MRDANPDDLSQPWPYQQPSRTWVGDGASVRCLMGERPEEMARRLAELEAAMRATVEWGERFGAPQEMMDLWRACAGRGR